MNCSNIGLIEKEIAVQLEVRNKQFSFDFMKFGSVPATAYLIKR